MPIPNNDQVDNCWLRVKFPKEFPLDPVSGYSLSSSYSPDGKDFEFDNVMKPSSGNSLTEESGSFYKDFLKYVPNEANSNVMILEGCKRPLY